MSEPMFEWTIKVKKRNTYGDKYVSSTPAVIRAATKTEVTEKVRAAFGATYDEYRKFWSHDWTLTSVREVGRSEISFDL